MISFFYVKMMK